MSTRLQVDELKAQLADKLTIARVAEGLGIELQAAGDQWRALCPLHQENTPSFYLSDAKGMYHCFGCKAGGDRIDLVKRVRHLSFPEALRWLAELGALDISEYERPMTDQERAQEAFRGWCEAWLAAIRVPERVDPDTAVEFGVTERRGADLLALPPVPTYFEQDRGYLLDGVVLPWRSPSGRLVGWRVREMQGRDKRVGGTPNDFPLGKITEQTLFGAQVARQHIKDGTLVAVEGEYDCMAMHAHGIKNVVAMGGSSFTRGQMELLRALRVRRLVLLFDGDDAGRAGARAMAERYWAGDEVQVRLAVCPDGMDPEEAVRKLGDWPLMHLVESAPVALEYILRQEWAIRKDTLTDKLDFVKWIRDSYGQKLRSTDESLVLAEVAKWLGVPELTVRDFVRSNITDLTATDSERVLLGACCSDQRYYAYLRTQLQAEDFFMLRHQRLWTLLAEMLMDNQDFDLPTIQSRGQAAGIPPEYVRELTSLSGANLDYHRDQVADMSLRRSTRDDAQAFRDRIADLQFPAEQAVGELTGQVTTKALRRAGTMQRQLPEQVDEAMGILHERMRNPDEVHGLSLGTQYPHLTRTLQGIQAHRLVLLSAISGVGKSTMAMGWAAALAVHQSIPVDFVSLEMDEAEILYKIASHMTGVDSMKITGGSLADDEAVLVEHAMARIRKSPLHIWTPDGLTGTEFMLYARESVMQRRTRAFFVDYVQLVDPERGQERENGYKLYGDFGRLCKMKVARAMGVAVVCCAQLRRSASGKERPTKEDMGDSYALVRHSDVILVLHAPDEDTSTMHLWVDKNRQGLGGVLLPIIHRKPQNTFYEASGGTKSPEYLVVT